MTTTAGNALFFPYGFYALFNSGLLRLKGAIYMDLIPPEKRKVTPEKAIALLEKEGIKITEENAALVADFMYLLTLMFYKQYADL